MPSLARALATAIFGRSRRFRRTATTSAHDTPAPPRGASIAIEITPPSRSPSPPPGFEEDAPWGPGLIMLPSGPRPSFSPGTYVPEGSAGSSPPYPPFYEQHPSLPMGVPPARITCSRPPGARRSLPVPPKRPLPLNPNERAHMWEYFGERMDMSMLLREAGEAGVEALLTHTARGPNVSFYPWYELVYGPGAPEARGQTAAALGLSEERKAYLISHMGILRYSQLIAYTHANQQRILEDGDELPAYSPTPCCKAGCTSRGIALPLEGQWPPIVWLCPECNQRHCDEAWAWHNPQGLLCEYHRHLDPSACAGCQSCWITRHGFDNTKGVAMLYFIERQAFVWLAPEENDEGYDEELDEDIALQTALYDQLTRPQTDEGEREHDAVPRLDFSALFPAHADDGDQSDSDPDHSNSAPPSTSDAQAAISTRSTTAGNHRLHSATDAAMDAGYQRLSEVALSEITRVDTAKEYASTGEAAEDLQIPPKVDVEEEEAWTVGAEHEIQSPDNEGYAQASIWGDDSKWAQMVEQAKIPATHGEFDNGETFEHVEFQLGADRDSRDKGKMRETATIGTRSTVTTLSPGQVPLVSTHGGFDNNGTFEHAASSSSAPSSSSPTSMSSLQDCLRLVIAQTLEALQPGGALAEALEAEGKVAQTLEGIEAWCALAKTLESIELRGELDLPRWRR